MVLPLTRTGSRTSPRARSRAHSTSQALKFSNCTAGSPALPPLTNSPNHAFSTPSSAHSSCDDAYQCFALARANALQVRALLPFALRATPSPSIRHTIHSSWPAPVLRPRNSFSIGNIQRLKYISGPRHRRHRSPALACAAVTLSLQSKSFPTTPHRTCLSDSCRLRLRPRS